MFSEWMDFSISALITDCRYAGLQDSRAYARAVAIDPDRDMAYRYWGNVLMRENKLKDAKVKRLT
jgi:hypothetical protein